MAVMRRSTSAISPSDAPDFNTMIISGLPGWLAGEPWQGSPDPSDVVKRKRPRARRPRPRSGHRRGRSVRPRLPDRSAESRWTDLRKVEGGEIEEPEAEPPDRGAHVRAEHATEPAAVLSSAFPAAEAGQDALAVVVERQAEGGDDGGESDCGDGLLLADVGAEVRGDPRGREPARRRD